MMKQLQNIFFRGLLTFLPVALTIYILYAGILIVENFLGGVLRQVMPTYIPGLGFLLTLVLIFAFGLMLNNFIISSILSGVEKKLKTIPFVKAVYSPLSDLMNLFSKKGGQGLKSVVLVDIGQNGIQMLGLVTRDSFRDIEGLKDHSMDKIAVYIPLSYALGGYTILASRDKVKAVDIPVDKAMSLALTAWIQTKSADTELEQK